MRGYIDRRLKLILQLAVIAVLLILWEMMPRLFEINPLILPTFSDSVNALGSRLTGEGSLWSNTWVTLQEILGAFIIAVLVGVILGVVVGAIKPVRRLATPFLLAAFAVPIMVLIPLFLVSLGLGMPSKIGFGALYA